MNLKKQPYTTHRNLRKFQACQERYDFLKTWAGDRKDFEPIYLYEILEKNGIQDAAWALRAIVGGIKWKPLFVEFAIWNAKQVCKDPTWNKWADAWLGGSDRTRKSAREAWAAAAARAAWAAAAWAARAAREAAAAAAAVWAWAAAVWAARAAREAWAVARSDHYAEAAEWLKAKLESL